MNKFSLTLITLISLVLLASVVLAEDTNSTDDETDSELEEAEETQLPADEMPEKAYIRTLFFSGTGLATNPLDAMDFFTVKIVTGKVALTDGSLLGKGILVLDETKYRLTELTVEGDSAEAKIVSYTDLNTTGTEIGSLSLTKIAKPLVDVWAGTMTLEGKEYHFYLTASKRKFNQYEIAEKAKNYCKENPYDETCKSVAGYLCKDNTEDCKQKVARYCEDHSDDSRCKEIIRSYCAGNMKDGRCREQVRNYCKENPNSNYCQNEVVELCKENSEDETCTNVFGKYCETHSDDSRCTQAGIAFCKNNPVSENCAPIIKQYCEYNQTSELCGKVKINFCEENPEDARCKTTAAALCKMEKFKDSEKCNSIQEIERERIKSMTAVSAKNMNQVNK